MIKVIVGARRTGKTTMLAKEVKDTDKEILYYVQLRQGSQQFEELINKFVEPILEFDSLRDYSNVVLVIDDFDIMRKEEKSEFFKWINYIDRHNIDVYITLTPTNVIDKRSYELTPEAQLILNVADEVSRIRTTGLMDHEYMSSEQYIYEILGEFIK